MNTLLLIFFALPIAVIVISIALQKILKCPFLVAGIIFAIFLVVTFIIGNLIYLVAAIAYAILAFITAVITKLICRILKELDERNGRGRCGCSDNRRNNCSTAQLLTINGSCSNNDNDWNNENCRNNNCRNNNGNLLTISSSGCNGIENELLTINSNCSRNNNDDNNNCSCNCNTSNDSIAVRANVFPNSNSNGNCGTFNGCFRRRRG